MHVASSQGRALGLVAALTVAFAGCRDTASGTPLAGAGPDWGTGLTTDGGHARSRPGRLSPLARKRSLVDGCVFGALALFDARDHFVAQDPTVGRTAGSPASRMPSRMPWPSAPAPSEPGGNDVLATTIVSCSLAQGMSEPSAPAFDTELAAFAPFAARVREDLEAWTRESARRGSAEAGNADAGPKRPADADARAARSSALRERLASAFAELDERWLSLWSAAQAWNAEPLVVRSEVAPAAEPPASADRAVRAAAIRWDEQARMVDRAMRSARWLATGLVSARRPAPTDVARAALELERATEELEAASRSAPRSPYVRRLLPRLRAFLATIEGLQRMASTQPREAANARGAKRGARLAEPEVPDEGARVVALGYADLAGAWRAAMTDVLREAPADRSESALGQPHVVVREPPLELRVSPPESERRPSPGATTAPRGAGGASFAANPGPSR